MVHVALRFGERPEVALVLPLSVDGMLVVASAAMVDDKRAGRPVRLSARLAFTVGMFASIAANVVGAHPNLGARIVAGWPALALLLVVEMLSRSGRALRQPLTQSAVEPGEALTTEAHSRQALTLMATQSGHAVADSADACRILNAGAESAAPVADLAPAPWVGPGARPVEAPAEEDELTAARTVAGELSAAGRRITRDGLARALRERGHRVGTDRAAVLVRAVAAG
jgi:hypothetical protein